MAEPFSDDFRRYFRERREQLLRDMMAREEARLMGTDRRHSEPEEPYRLHPKSIFDPPELRRGETVAHYLERLKYATRDVRLVDGAGGTRIVKVPWDAREWRIQIVPKRPFNFLDFDPAPRTEPEAPPKVYRFVPPIGFFLSDQEHRVCWFPDHLVHRIKSFDSLTWPRFRQGIELFEAQDAAMHRELDQWMAADGVTEEELKNG